MLDTFRSRTRFGVAAELFRNARSFATVREEMGTRHDSCLCEFDTSGLNSPAENSNNEPEGA